MASVGPSKRSKWDLKADADAPEISSSGQPPSSSLKDEPQFKDGFSAASAKEAFAAAMAINAKLASAGKTIAKPSLMPIPLIAPVSMF